MASEETVTDSPETAIVEPRTLPSAEMILPLSNAEVLWRAKHLVPSLFLDHLPFLFWLVADLRPGRVVTLGLEDGVAHFAICQAVERLGLTTECLGIALLPTPDPEDTPEAKAQPAEGVKASLSSYNSMQYEEFSRLVAVSAAEAPALVEDGSVDLVVVEGDAPRDLLEQIETGWLPKLSPKGVLLLPGSTGGSPEDIRKRFRGLSAGRRHFFFDHGTGLGVLLPEAPGPGRLEILRQGLQDCPRLNHVGRFFERLGRLYRLEVETGEASGAQVEARNNYNWAKRLEREKAELNTAYDKRHLATATLQAELQDAHRQLEAAAERDVREQELQQALDERFEEIAALTEKLAEAELRLQELGPLSDQVAEAELLQAQLQQALDERFEEIAALTGRLSEIETQAADFTAREQGLRQALEERFEKNAVLSEKLAEAELRLQQLGGLPDQVAQLQQERDALSFEVGALRRSTSWKLTAPVRAFGRTFRRR